MNINLNFKKETILGKGKNLWTVIYITEESEDSTVQLWLADNEKGLRKQVMSYVVGDEDNFGYEIVCEQFESELWGRSILFNKVGKVNLEK